MFPDNPLPIWSALLFYIPLGVIGAWRWSVWLLQKLAGFRYRPVPPSAATAKLSLSIVTPVYNEDPALFSRALSSWQRNRPDEIIAVIDASDRACIQVFENFQKEYASLKLFVTEIPGKRSALALGARAARSNIIALVDSDTLWEGGIRDHLLAPFADERVGGVAPRQAVIKADTLARKLFSVRFDQTFFHEFPYLMSIGNRLICISGRTAVYRKRALLPVLDEMVYETFLGKPCISGEDKRLTSLVQRDGWLTRYQASACVQTPGAQTISTYAKQGLRWARNSWRTDIRIFFSAWAWKSEWLFLYHLLDRAISPFTLLLGPIYLGVAISLHHWTFVKLILTWWLVSRTVRLWPHLRRVPWDIGFVPLYIVMQYPTAVLKIYALLSLDFQSWLTRWHKQRMRMNSFFELLPSRIATVAIVFGLSFVIFQYQKTVALAAEAERARKAIAFTETVDLAPWETEEAQFWKTREEHAGATYITEFGDTPKLLMRRFNVPAAAYGEVFGRRLPTFPLSPGLKFTFPVKYLQTPLTPENMPGSISRALITSDPWRDTITVKGRGSVVTLRSIVAALPPGQKDIEEVSPGEWILRASLDIGEDVILLLDGNEVRWLKLASSPESFVSVRSRRGSMLIRNTRITSWNEGENTYDTDPSDGRALIVAYTNGRMDIAGSEIAYLGYPLDVAHRLGTTFGGTYGLSWKIPDNTFGQHILAGSLVESSVHHNYFGLYSFGATGLLIRKNEIYENLQYGIDPHDDSNNLLIEENFIHENGNHGIIGSKRVMYSTIRNNTSVSNRLHGIMLHDDSNFNLVEGNRVSGNTNGIVLYASHQNLIRENSIVGNEIGVRANNGSAGNIFRRNAVRSNERGFFFYGNATRNLVAENEIRSNALGIALKEVAGNTVAKSLRAWDNTIAIRTDDSSRTTNTVETIQ